jgi:aspartate 1-decarboxylase
LDEQEADKHQPTLCYFENAKHDNGVGVSDEELRQRNKLTGMKSAIPVQTSDM